MMKPSIDFANIETYPKELGRILNDFFRDYNERIHYLAERIGDFKDNNSVDQLIIDIKNSGLIEDSQIDDKISLILNSYGIICYHASRFLDPRMIIHEGLHTNEIQSYCDMMEVTLSRLEFQNERIEEAIREIRNVYNKENGIINKKEYGVIGFFFPSCLVDSGYDVFFNNIGGERARDLFEESGLFEDVFSALTRNGMPCLVKANVNFNVIRDIDKERIVSEIIKRQVADNIFKIQYDINFKCFSKEDIPSDRIIECKVV